MTNLKSIIRRNRREGYGRLAFLMALALLISPIFTSCINDVLEEPDPTKNPSNELSVILNLTLSSSDESRSSTESDGTSDEDPDIYDAFENESKLNTVDFYFCNGDYPVLSKGVSVNQDLDENKNIKIMLTLSKEELIKLKAYDKLSLLVLANFNTFKHNLNELKTELDPFNSIYQFQKYTGNYFVGEFPEYGQTMPFVSKENYVVTLGEEFKDKISEEMIEAFTYGEGLTDMTKDEVVSKISQALTNAFSSVREGNAIKLERLVSRFDYKDAGKLVDINKKRIANTFPIIAAQEGVKEVNDLTLKLTALVPVNVSKEAYIFRHTAKGDAEAANYDNTKDPGEKFTGLELFGLENNNIYFGKKPGDLMADGKEVPEGADVTTYHWFASNDWEKKMTYSAAVNGSWTGPFLEDKDKNKYPYFLNQPIKSTATTANPTYPYEIVDDNWIMVEKFMGYDDKKYKEEETKNSYHPVCYISENTLPSTATMIRGLSTGIAFRMLLCDATGKKIEKITSGDQLKDGEEDLYGGMITLNENGTIKLTVNGEEIDLAWQDYDDEEIEALDDEEEEEEKEEEEEEEEETEEPSFESGYYLTYYYFFRHNFDSTDRTNIQPMQFGVVRNNIYRVSIAGFNGLPRPYNPEDPDEPSDDKCLALEIHVLAWARRDITVNW